MSIFISERGNVATRLQPGRASLDPEVGAKYPYIILEHDNWNDFGWNASCQLHVQPYADVPVLHVGHVRIIRKDQSLGEWTFHGQPTFYRDKLPLGFCSLGTQYGFYKRLMDCSQVAAIKVLAALRDAAFDPAVWKRFKDERAFRDALLRESSAAAELRDLVPRLYGKKPSRRISRFLFKHVPAGSQTPLTVPFDFARRKGVPTRYVLLVGPNGAGKTQLLSRLAIALTGATSENVGTGKDDAILQKRQAAGVVSPVPSFYGVIAISFNAFDRFEIPQSSAATQSRFSYTYCGLRTADGLLQDEQQLTEAIQIAVDEMTPEQNARFREAAARLVPAVAGVGVGAIPYAILSAGQKIVLNIITHLIARLRKRMLVLLDEPETHLHPTLIVGLLTEVSRLLEEQDSNAIIATHSPLIAQQTPSHRVRVIARVGGAIEVTEPSLECFGAHLSALASALFDAAERRRDYTHVLDDLLKRDGNNPAKTEARFPKGLSDNARFYLWSSAKKSPR